MAERKLKLELPGELIVHWDEEALEALTEGATERPWHLHGEPLADTSALRVLSARTGSGALLLVAALRPDDADGHDAEQPQGLLVDDDGVTELHEVLLSTEYDRGGAARRIGLELYTEEDGYATRGAGETTTRTIDESDGWRREIAQLEFRLNGESGVASYEIWHRA